MGFDEANQHLGKSGIKASTFPSLGTTREGIIRDAEVQNVTNQKGEVQYQKDGVTPQEQLVITWDSNEFDESDPTDTGKRRLYLKWRAQRALTDAIYAATGKREMEEGAKVRVTFTGEEAVPGSAFKAKVYDVAYEKPTKTWDASGDLKDVEGVELNMGGETYPQDKIDLALTLAAKGTDVNIISTATSIPVDYLEKNVLPV